jgi:hypothetical protein
MSFETFLFNLHTSLYMISFFIPYMILLMQLIKNCNKHNNQNSAPNLCCSHGRHKTQERLPCNKKYEFLLRDREIKAKIYLSKRQFTEHILFIVLYTILIWLDQVYMIS